MDTISPGLEDHMPAPIEFRMPELVKSPTFWASVAMVVLFVAVAVWRFQICMFHVLACTR